MSRTILPFWQKRQTNGRLKGTLAGYPAVSPASHAASLLPSELSPAPNRRRLFCVLWREPGSAALFLLPSACRSQLPLRSALDAPRRGAAPEAEAKSVPHPLPHPERTRFRLFGFSGWGSLFCPLSAPKSSGMILWLGWRPLSLSSTEKAGIVPGLFQLIPLTPFCRCRAGNTCLFAPAAPHGCQSRRSYRFPAPGCGRRPGCWTPAGR